MSLADRGYMRAQPTGRTVRLAMAPVDAIDAAPSPSATPLQAAQERRSRFSSPSRLRRRRRRLLGLLSALTGLFTLAWAVGCAIVGASLQTEGGTFTSPKHERTSRHGDQLPVSLPA